MNLTELDGKYYALDGTKILRRDFNKVFGALYRAKLAAHLARDMGLKISYIKNGEWRLDRISTICEKEFSTRRSQILDEKIKNGLSDFESWRRTRRKKDPPGERIKFIQRNSEVKLWWMERFNRIKNQSRGMSESGESIRRRWAEESRHLSVEAGQEFNGERPAGSFKKKWQLALRRATQGESLSSEENLIKEFLYETMRDENWEDVSYQKIGYLLKEEVSQGRILKFDNYYTSWEVIRAEREYLEMSNKSCTIALPGIHDDDDDDDGGIFRRVEEVSVNFKKQLSLEQKSAAVRIISSDELVTVVQGDAGAGKTTMLKAVSEVYQSEGVEVVGVATSGVAARNLEEETSIPSMTLRSYLSFCKKEKKGRAPKVVIVDEASMIDSRSAAELFRRADENHDKIILVGDRNQLESVGAGRVFERLVELKEDSNRLIYLGENFRQRNPTLRRAVQEARKSNIKESLKILDEAGLIFEIENKFVKGESSSAISRRKKVAEEYSDKTLIITSTRSAGTELNFLIREKLKEKDGLLKKEMTFNLVSVNKEEEEPVMLKLAEGERIIFTRNEYKDYDIRNGERATIEKLHPIRRNIITVRTEDGRKLNIDTKKYKHIDYGYALTTYKAQGQTYDKVVVEADTSGAPALNTMRAQYVNITRARDSVKIYTDDKEALFGLAEELTHKKDTLDKLDITLKEAMEKEKEVEEAAEGYMSLDEEWLEAAKESARLEDERYRLMWQDEEEDEAMTEENKRDSGPDLEL